VLLLERFDFASGTSSKSTKLVHGGLRYLQQLQFGVTLESLRERQMQMRLAPHMVWSMPFVVPTYKGSWFKNTKLNAGLWIYDLMAGVRGNDFHRKISAAEVRKLCPGIKSEGLTGGFLYSDCRTDDARHTLAVIKSACDHGALAMNYAKVTGFLRQRGRIVGVEFVDSTDAKAQPVRVLGSRVINATGVWSEVVTKSGGVRRTTTVVPAKGVHVTVSQQRLPITSAMIVNSVHDKRFCFAVPWYDCVVIGTTDTEYDGDMDKLTVTAQEKVYILDAVNAAFPGLNLTEDDITGEFAGLRPLIKPAGKKGSTAAISRQHSLEESVDGLVSIAGGKLTTYRLMAAETVDYVADRLMWDDPELHVPDCRTDQIPLGGWSRTEDINKSVATLARDAFLLGLDAETAAYLPSAYGSETRAVLALAAEVPSLAARISAPHPYILAQVVYAVRCEAALTLDDVLSRRIRLVITDRAAALAAAEAVSDLMAVELSWSQDRKAAEVARFRQEVG
jgi:glycerol-3-phosphate dehydrogenase